MNGAASETSRTRDSASANASPAASRSRSAVPRSLLTAVAPKEIPRGVPIRRDMVSRENEIVIACVIAGVALSAFVADAGAPPTAVSGVMVIVAAVLPMLINNRRGS